VPPHQRGSVFALTCPSQALSGNPWEDPTDRDLWVYTPRGYNPEGERRYPAVLLLPPFSATGESMLARSLTGISIATRIDRLIADGACAPFVAVLPDAMTSLVGSQYVDSPGIGNYAAWLVDEVLPFAEAHLLLDGRWGVAGRSSGGFGGLHLAMNHPGRFAAVASLAGDMGFDLAYLGEIPGAVGPIRAAGGPMAFARAFWTRHSLPGSWFPAISLLCMSAAYSPDAGPAPDGFPARLPVDFETGAVDFDLLASWRRFDPIVQVERSDAAAALADLDLLWMDAGDNDEYHLQLGLRRFVAALSRAGIDHHHEEFPGGHRGTSYRFDAALPAVVRALSGES